MFPALDIFIEGKVEKIFWEWPAFVLLFHYPQGIRKSTGVAARVFPC
jgi:hypothetical protein